MRSAVQLGRPGDGTTPRSLGPREGPGSASGHGPQRCRPEVSIKVQERLAGTRSQHGVKGNALKRYDQFATVRVECLIAEPGDFKAYRPQEGAPEGPKPWRRLRLGIADRHRRVQVSQAANERSREAKAALQDRTPRHDRIEPWCRPALEPARPKTGAAAAATARAATTEPATALAPPPPATAHPTPQRKVRPRRVRALNPLAAAAAPLLPVVRRHEFLVHDRRNRDLRRLLFGAAPVSSDETGGSRRR